MEALSSRVSKGLKYLFFVWGVIPGSLTIVALLYRLHLRAFYRGDDILILLLALPFIIGFFRGGKLNVKTQQT